MRISTWVVLALTGLLSACTSTKPEPLVLIEAEEELPYFLEVPEVLAQIASTLEVCDSPPDFKDCSPLFTPLFPPVICDSYQMSLWREGGTGDIWIAQVGGIGGRIGKWFGPINQDIPDVQRLRALLPSVLGNAVPCSHTGNDLLP